MRDFVIKDGVLEKCTSQDEVVIIPKGVTKIGEHAFSSCRSLSKVVIPEEVTEIGFAAFSSCESLQEVVMPQGITKLSSWIFSDCTSLREVIIPKEVSVIAEWTFANCKSLSKVVISEGVIAIGNAAFKACESLRELEIPETVTTIGYNAFRDCTSLQKVAIPKGVTKISNRVFEGCTSLSEIVIPESVTEIDNGAFDGCTSLSKVVIPEGVTTIRNSAFFGCKGLEEVVIPESMTSISWWAFSECRSLKEIVIPEGVTTLPDDVFSGCLGLEKIDLKSTKCKISHNTFGVKFPPKLLSQVKELYPKMTDGAIKKYLLEGNDFAKLEPELQYEIFMKRQGKSLVDAYLKYVKEPEILGNEILKNLEGKVSAKECKAVVEFMKMFVDAVTTELLQKLYEALKTLKTAEKALQTMEEDVVLMEKLNGNSEEILSELEQKVIDILKEEKRTAKKLEIELKESYAIDSLPNIRQKDGSEVAPFVFYWLMLGNYWEKNSWEWSISEDYTDGKIELTQQEQEVIDRLDYESLQNALLELADAYLGITGNSKKMYLAYPICRYADERLMAELTKRAPSWRSKVSGNDAPPLRNFRAACIYSNTRAAMMFAEKYQELYRYAMVRDTDADTIRDQYLSDIGLDVNGKKTYELGNQTVTACLQKDLTFLVELENGKTAKSIPKKGADIEKYEKVNADFKEMKTMAKKIVKNRKTVLFRDFINGHTRKAMDWKNAYLHNPLLKMVASLLVWVQDKNTFLLTEKGAITSDGDIYTIDDNLEIALAHPMEMEKEDVTAWQKYFTSNGIKQPFEQIWEPVIDLASVKENRYAGCMIPYYRFIKQGKHGITVEDYDFHDYIEIHIKGCSTYIERIDCFRHEINMDDRFEIKKFSVTECNRQTNHIVAYLDRITVYGRIYNDDVNIAEILPQFTMAQIMEFIKIATENHCVSVTALLLDYKQKNFADYDPMEEFSLDW